MPNWYEKLKEFFQDKKGKRRFENLVIILVLGIIIIIVAGSFSGEKKERQNKTEKPETVVLTSNTVDELEELERKLEKILSEIEGAGTVKVMVTGNSDGEVVHAYNETEESVLREEQNDGQSSGRSDEKRLQREMVLVDSGTGGRVPVVVQKIKPEIKGVVVVADGAGSSVVRQNILNAVEALLGIPSHRIQVLKRK